MQLNHIILVAILFFANLAQSANQPLATTPLVQAVNQSIPLFTQAESGYLKKSQMLTVCSVAQAAGSDASIDLVKLIAKDSGIYFIASPSYSWKQGLAALTNGDCDILPWATNTKTRQQQMLFTRPYARISRVIVTRKEQSFIARIDDVGHKIFATEKGNNIVNQLKQKYPKIHIVHAEHTADALKMVSEGKAFASIASLYSVATLFNTSRLNDLKIGGSLPPEFDDVVTLATRKDDKILHQILDKYVASADSQEIRKFMNRGAIFTYDSTIDYLKLWLIFGTIAILFSIMLWWNRHLTRLNNQLEKARIELEKKTKELEVLSITDSLTNTYNRVKIDRVFGREITLSERYNHALSIFMIDIDYFKNVNDTCGHWVGDQVLVKFAKVLKDNLRSNDFLGRWGGEEFLVICPSTGLKETQLVAEKLRKIIQKTDFSPAKQITASFGVAEWKTGDSQENLVSKADYAMYLSKHKGRNRVTVADNPLK